MATGTDTTRASRRRAIAVKVPQITLMFWVLKLLTTGIGESISDFMGQHSVPIAAAVGIFGLAFALWLQFRSDEYRAPVYWFAVLMVAVFGTMAADGIHDGANIPYAVTTPLFGAIVAVTFLVWRRTEGTLSIRSITTRRRESFYWLAVLGTFALGTAAGDLTATSLNLGYWGSAVLFAVVIAVPAVGWASGKFNPIFAFWFAYVITRPLGASFADGFSKPTNGGLSLGDGLVSLIGLIVFVALVTYITVTKRDVQTSAAERQAHLPHSHLAERVDVAERGSRVVAPAEN
jgi:uncharacterized membrane-anchored protein